MHISALKNKNGVFALLELDNSLKISSLLELDLKLDDNKLLLTELNKQFLLSLSPNASGVVMDPAYTLPLIDKKANQAGLALRLEKIQEETDPLVVPSLIPNWGVELIRQNYGVAKLELYYHPKEEGALKKKQLVSELFDFCQYEHIDFLLKLVVYTQADEEFSNLSFQEAQLQSIEEFRSSCNLMALQHPFDALAVATVTSELDIPWIVSLTGADYQINKDNLRTCLENGAQGFMAGEILWQGLKEHRTDDQALDLNALFAYIQTTVRDRFLELERISNEELSEAQLNSFSNKGDL